MNETKSESSQSKPKQIGKDTRPNRIDDQLKNAIQATDSQNSPAKSQEANARSASLSTNVATRLLHMMEEVTRNEITPQTVNAACGCATQIVALMKVNIEMKKAGM